MKWFSEAILRSFLTLYFSFDAGEVESIITHELSIEANGENCSVTFSPNATLHVNVETMIMHALRYGQEFSLTENNVEYRIR